MTELSRAIPIHELIPHRGPMHLVDEIVWVNTKAIEGEVRAVIRAGAPYFRAAGFERHWLIELAAQASAALYQFSRKGSLAISPKGYLVSVRQFSLPVLPDGDAIGVGDELLLHVLFEVEAFPLGQSRCEIRSRDRLVGSGELTFLLDDSTKEFSY